MTALSSPLTIALDPVDPARGPGYAATREHLADWATVTALLFERLVLIRRALPGRALVTADAHGVYAALGFHPPRRPDYFMERLSPAYEAMLQAAGR